MRPKEVIEIWVDLFNKDEAIQLSDLYHEDAVNHLIYIQVRSF